MAAPFSIPEDIGNRGLQYIGAERISAFTENSKNANEVSFVYDKERQAELRRNTWRFATRKAVLRPVDITTMQLVTAAWNVSTQYLSGSIVTFNSSLFIAIDPNIGITPGTGLPWAQYFGPMTVSAWDTTALVANQGTAYYSGELVYTPQGLNPGVYLSLENGNTDIPATISPWSSSIVYNQYATVAYNGNTYQSTQDLNLNNTPTGVAPWVLIPANQVDSMSGQNWLKLGAATVQSLAIVWPIGSGPASQLATRNVFQLPNGFLRVAPTDPKAGSTSYLGSPMGQLRYEDWEFQGNYITSGTALPIMLRFVANIDDVTAMDPMFCEGLACRIGISVCEALTQSDGKLQAIGAMYKAFMNEARTVNGIETGATEPPMDDYIAARF